MPREKCQRQQIGLSGVGYSSKLPSISLIKTYVNTRAARPRAAHSAPLLAPRARKDASSARFVCESGNRVRSGRSMPGLVVRVSPGTSSAHLNPPLPHLSRLHCALRVPSLCGLAQSVLLQHPEMERNRDRIGLARRSSPLPRALDLLRRALLRSPSPSCGSF